MRRLCKNTINNLDEGIRKFIIWLNKNDFETRFSCSGHPRRRLQDYPPHLQELKLCRKYQLGKRLSVLCKQTNGYIYFKNKPDASKIYGHLAKMDNYKRLKLGGIRDKEGRIIKFDSSNLTQKKIDAFWEDCYYTLSTLI